MTTNQDMSHRPSIMDDVAQALDNVLPKATTTTEQPKVDKVARKRGQSKGQGQRGAKLERSWGDLNAKQKRILIVCTPEPGEHRAQLKIAEIAELTGWTSRESKAKANSHVRNSLRVLVRAQLMEHASSIGDGTYRVTDAGKQEVRKHEAEVAERHKKERKAKRVKRNDTGAPATETQAAAPAETPAQTETPAATTEPAAQ